MSQFLEMKESSQSSFRYFHYSIFLALFCLYSHTFPQNVTAISATNLWNNHSSKTLKHWNLKKKKITGYTEINYSFSENGEQLIETSRNLHQDKEVFSEKKLWFTASGELTLYEEIDLKSGFKTQNLHEKNQINTRIWKKGEKTSFSIPKEDNLVPFEIISHYLQSKIPQLKKRSSFKFNLYLPAIALELKNKGFPTSFSIIEMKAKVSTIKSMQTLFGDKKVVVLTIRPTSFLINALLPDEKSVFWFTYLKNAPYELISFREGNTEFILEKYKP